MNFNSLYHGNLEYTEKDIMTFNKGIPGFEGLTKFILVNIKDNEQFKLLHSLEDEALGFILTSPFNVINDYEVNIPDDVIKNLEIDKPEDVLIYNTVTLSTDIKKITTNLRAPLIININNNLGEQLILNNENYKVKHPLIKETPTHMHS
ncbi:flagellar assembly factor FliW [Clostridium cavendishii DSM 21758]|uniref:Flagellar assembly factor FliW n=1 Tax=Clostridium cavendishii DSM 21758 TaxID=1121302 RepID=A0A1M6B2S8_9CLOT|nr:flagellar assembly protein FliW [Clostridium cavendishii]SHI43044.1 flagellar assembly factor FliW [Clostridium cavendishii DSM 21758]